MKNPSIQKVTLELEEVLIEALETKRPVTFFYEGFYRLATPHELGYKDDKLHCMVWQYGGFSSKGEVNSLNANWRCMDVSKITDLKIVDGSWITGGHHKMPSMCIDYTIMMIDF